MKRLFFTVLWKLWKFLEEHPVKFTIIMLIIVFSIRVSIVYWNKENVSYLGLFLETVIAMINSIAAAVIVFLCVFFISEIKNKKKMKT